MEHVTITPEAGQQVHLTAEKGYLLRSKKTGREYTEISTLDMKRWEVVENPDSTKRKAVAPKPRNVRHAVNPAHE